MAGVVVASGLRVLLRRAGLWTLAELASRRTSWQNWAAAAAKLHVPAAIGVGAILIVTMRGYTVGGSDKFSIPHVIGRTFLLAVGIDSESVPLLVVGSLLVLAAIVLGLVLLWRAGDLMWIFFAVTILIAPGLLLLTRPAAMMERFFYVPIVFFLVLMSYLCVQVWCSGWFGPSLAVFGLLLLLGCNVNLTAGFMKFGRGQYLAAVRMICRQTEGDRIRVGSDHSFRNGLLLMFYFPFVKDARPIYEPKIDAKDPAEWFIFHTVRTDQKWPAMIKSKSGVHYYLVKHFPHVQPSGFDWGVYHLSGSDIIDPDSPDKDGRALSPRPSTPAR